MALRWIQALTLLFCLLISVDVKCSNIPSLIPRGTDSVTAAPFPPETGSDPEHPGFPATLRPSAPVSVEGFRLSLQGQNDDDSLPGDGDPIVVGHVRIRRQGPPPVPPVPPVPPIPVPPVPPVPPLPPPEVRVPINPGGGGGGGSFRPFGFFGGNRFAVFPTGGYGGWRRPVYSTYYGGDPFSSFFGTLRSSKRNLESWLWSFFR